MVNHIIITSTNLPGLKHHSRGKVRDIYDLGSELLIIATDRISAFDVILPNGVPDKGAVLTQLSAFWFQKTRHIIPNHLIAADVASFPDSLQRFTDQLRDRAMLVKKAERIDAECVVRGYMAGSAWAEYRQSGTVCGERLAAGLRESEELPEPVFTPSTKAAEGHDENISTRVLADTVGADLARRLEEKSLEMYRYAAAMARERGIIIADTKMEFGLIDGELVLIDELLTPDSSRFWEAETYRVGESQPSFDKQFVRDWLEESGWNKEPPAPQLPPEVVEKTRAKYLEAYRRIVGKPLFEKR
ncbi:MAG: phosphoribosylaminoimidazolesuccinocarboxamide synthase [Chloroflexi bacterium]|nr:phosphoribosylaminoimidazolesuccinocarboxamide synthase [Chloroflexota bacterium]